MMFSLKKKKNNFFIINKTKKKTTVVFACDMSFDIDRSDNVVSALFQLDYINDQVAMIIRIFWNNFYFFAIGNIFWSLYLGWTQHLDYLSGYSCVLPAKQCIFFTSQYNVPAIIKTGLFHEGIITF